jgi:hypothetical protein
MIKSINTDNNQIILDILELHVPSKKIDVDLTYSKGQFYKDGRISQPAAKFDLFPQTPDTIQANSENVPLLDNSVNCVIFDPVFCAGESPSKTSLIRNRFGGMKTVKNIWDYYTHSLREIHRILRKDGICIFKCQDTVSSGKNWFSHVYICNEAESFGFYPKDLFVLIAKGRMNNWPTQKHSRKYHAFFWVFIKK